MVYLLKKNPNQDSVSSINKYYFIFNFQFKPILLYLKINVVLQANDLMLKFFILIKGTHQLLHMEKNISLEEMELLGASLLV